MAGVCEAAMQTMSHLIACPLCPETCSRQDLMSASGRLSLWRHIGLTKCSLTIRHVTDTKEEQELIDTVLLCHKKCKP
ncbi:hypothetical protein B5X24_HaOG207919 [Helicoverpa armigera]|uniref:Uncharacterized protein n=1 Tax=Helicoverpa armigera TaxID=29058 RepID=A0A2W1BHS5_HELAM|nr:hypothetical protein B5X24_HaOG207919 [Helicoverpa armigera]